MFIDEIHTLVGAGSAEGTMDAANMLKPALARGEITCIGATTEEHKTIAKDGALDRRFPIGKVEEPSKENCSLILKSALKYYENFMELLIARRLLMLVFISLSNTGDKRFRQSFRFIRSCWRKIKNFSLQKTSRSKRYRARVRNAYA